MENKILIVDDEEQVRRLLERILEGEGYSCILAEDAHEARQCLAAEEFAIVLCDVRMPGESGLDLIEFVCKEHPSTAAVMVSAADNPEVVQSALGIGVYGYIVKPFGADEVLINVACALRRRTLEIENRIHRENLENTVKERASELGETIRKLKSAEKQRSESEKLAATGRMAARVAHEINNPLAGIKNSFLLVRDAIPRDHPYYEYGARIEREIDRIARIVRQMYVLYKPDSESVREIQLEWAVRDVIALLETMCQDRGVNVKLDTKKPGVVVSQPQGQLTQVLFNVTRNAIEASPAGGMVTVSARADDDFVAITVSDQGSGIPEAVAPRVFEPFFSTKGEEEGCGLGLGLSISRSLVEGMGGTLSFHSRPNHGTVFEISVPVHGPSEENGNG